METINQQLIFHAKLSCLAGHPHLTSKNIQPRDQGGWIGTLPSNLNILNTLEIKKNFLLVWEEQFELCHILPRKVRKIMCC